MKKINKLVLPLATVALGTTVVAPLVTACAGKTTEEEVVVPEVELSDVNHGYTPEIEKHEASSSMTKTDAKAAYLAALKENPSIATEDYKNFVGQLPEYFSALQADNQEMYRDRESGSRKGTFDISINSLQAGLSNFELSNNGLVSYSTGVATNFSYETSRNDHDFEFDVDVDFVTAFKNFTLDVKRGETEYVDNLTVITPTWPSDLRQKDWSLSLALKGSVVVYMDGIKILDAQNLNFKKKFDYRDRILLSYINLTKFIKSEADYDAEFTEGEDPEQVTTTNADDEPIYIEGDIKKSEEETGSYVGSDKYLMDYLTDLGTFTSYYMSDVTVNPYFKLVGTPEFEPCTYEDYNRANWSSELIDRFQFYKGTLVFELEEEYNDIQEVNAFYNFVPLNYNASSTQPGEYGPEEIKSFPCIIVPYTQYPYKVTSSDPQHFNFEPYTDETGQVDKKKVKLSIWFNPVYNLKTTKDEDELHIQEIKGNLEEELQKIKENVPGISYNIEDLNERYLVSSYAENQPTLDFEIREFAGGSDSYVSTEEYSESYVLNEPLLYYHSDDSTFKNFYIPEELYYVYKSWENNTRYSTQYASSFGRYEGVDFNLSFETGTGDKAIKNGSRFLIGNWAMYDVIANEIYDNDLQTPTFPEPVINFASTEGAKLQKFDREQTYYYNVIEPLLKANIITKTDVETKAAAYVAWRDTDGEVVISNEVAECNFRTWSDYWRMIYQTTGSESYGIYEINPENKYGPFSYLQNAHEYMTYNEMKGQMSIQSITLDGKPFTNYSVANNVLTFNEDISTAGQQLNIVVRYLGPVESEYYYNYANYIIRNWTELMYYYARVELAPTEKTAKTTPDIKFDLPTDVYFYTIPFITCDVEE